MAYADYEDLILMTEELVSSVVKYVHGSYKTKFHTVKGEEYEINWEAPWRRIEMIPTLEECTGEKFPPADTMHTDEASDFFKMVLKKTGVECSTPLTTARMLDALVGHFLEEQCVSHDPIVHAETHISSDQPDLHSWSPADDVASRQGIPHHPWPLREIRGFCL